MKILCHFCKSSIAQLRISVKFVLKEGLIVLKEGLIL